MGQELDPSGSYERGGKHELRAISRRQCLRTRPSRSQTRLGATKMEIPGVTSSVANLKDGSDLALDPAIEDPVVRASQVVLNILGIEIVQEVEEPDAGPEAPVSTLPGDRDFLCDLKIDRVEHWEPTRTVPGPHEITVFVDLRVREPAPKLPDRDGLQAPRQVELGPSHHAMGNVEA